MDAFVRAGNRRVGPGGTHCACCMEFTNIHHTNEIRVRRYARRALKNADRNIYILGGRDRHWGR